MSYYQVEEGPAEARDISADFQLYTPDRLRRTGERSDGSAVGPQTPASSGRRGTRPARPLLPSPGRPGALAAPGQGGQASRTPCPSAQASRPPRRSDAGSSGAPPGPRSSPASPVRPAWPDTGAALGPGPSGPTEGAQPPHPSAECLRAVSGPQTIFGMRPGPAKCGRSLFRTPGQRSPAPFWGAGSRCPSGGGPPGAPSLWLGPPWPLPPDPRGQGGAPPPAAGGAPPPVPPCGLGLLPRSCCLAAGLPPAGVPPAGVSPPPVPLPSPSGGGARLAGGRSHLGRPGLDSSGYSSLSRARALPPTAP